MTFRDRSVLSRVNLVLLPLSLGLYLYSLSMNVAEVQRTVQLLGVGRTTTEPMKLLTTIRTLYESGDHFLAIMITLFTLVFPVGKYLALFYVLLGRSVRARGRMLNWVKNLGQWSMGDVFVVAFLVVIVKINTSLAQIHVEVLTGLYVFAASVLSSMLVSVMMAFDPDSLAERGPRTVDAAVPSVEASGETG